jgi:V8-like Glu-specific endopeptidase
MADERGDEKDQPKADGETLDENAATVQSSQQEDAQSIEIYWTEDRQRRAEPRPFPYQPPTPNQKARARPAMRSRGVNTEMQIPTDPKATPIQSPSNEEESVEALQAYWTEERMTRARPRALLPLKELAPSTKAPTTGPMKTDPMPPDEGVVEALATFETTEVPAAKYRSLPYAPVGKIFMTFNGIDSQATAWTIAESGVFTAGHCLYSKSEGWAKNILFRPQYREGASVGEWVPKYMWIPRGWGEDEDPAYDLAVFQTTKPIRPITGRLGTLANYEPDQGPYKAIGYPAEAVPD